VSLTLVDIKVQDEYPIISELGEWQRTMLESPTGANHRGYWLEYIQGELPVLELPSQHNRPPKRTFSGTEVKFPLNALKSSLENWAKASKTSLYTIVVAAWTILLHKYCRYFPLCFIVNNLSRQEEIVLGTSLHGRTDSKWESTIGHFVNVMPLRIQVPSSAASFNEYLSAISSAIIGHLTHQDYPFVKLIVRNLIDVSKNFSMTKKLTNWTQADIPFIKLKSITFVWRRCLLYLVCR
jgi:hypothetical protein